MYDDSKNIFATPFLYNGNAGRGNNGKHMNGTASTAASRHEGSRFAHHHLYTWLTLKVSVLGLRNTGKAHLWFKGHQYKAKQMSCHCVPATFYSLWNKCSSCRGADQLINWVIGLLRGNCMHIDSGHHRDTLRVCALPLALEPRSCYRISLV